MCTDSGSTSPCTRTYTSDTIEGLEWVYQQRNGRPVAAVNLSLGGGHFSATCDDEPYNAIAGNLRSAGIAVVASAGNSGFNDGIGSPACVSSIISVGSTTKGDQVNDFSNSAPILDLLAPGGDIRSSVPGGSFDVFSGTSMAAPHVAGAFALLRSVAPQASVAEILAALKTTGRPVRGKGIVRPRIDVAQAAMALGGGGGGGAGVGCPLVPDLACGGTVSTRNDGQGSFDALDSYPCSGNNYEGPEKLFELVPQTSGEVTVTLSGLTADLDLFVLPAADDDPCDADACLSSSTNGGSSSETVTFSAVAGRHYFLVVDGFQGAVSPFTLSASCAGGGGGGGGSCAPDAQTLCIDDRPGDRRFRVKMEFQNNQGSGFGNAIPLTSLGVTRGGLFWIGNQGNPEMLIKVLNACQPPFNRYWVFYAATTNQGLTTTVTDTATGRRWTRTNPRGTAAPPIQDTDAFPCQ